MPTLYTMSTTTPGSWKQLVDIVQANPGIALHDLHSRGEMPSQDEPWQWSDIQDQLFFSGARFLYVWIGLFISDDLSLPVQLITRTLKAGRSVLCFEQSPRIDESLRRMIAERVRAQAPDVVHKELAWQNTPLQYEPKLVTFLCTVYGHPQDIACVEVEIEALSGGERGTTHSEAKAVRVYGRDGKPRLPDLSLPYWQAILDSYLFLFARDTTEEEKLTSVQSLLEYEREYQESGLNWPDTGDCPIVSPLIFDLGPSFDSSLVDEKPEENEDEEARGE
ncbi:MAG: hypothetical protein H0U76_22220 [Ktedonobacteraceae bacterium]|nr:hypothetical protein [Ktedonobacteraceae bacterium]